MTRINECSCTSVPNSAFGPAPEPRPKGGIHAARQEVGSQLGARLLQELATGIKAEAASAQAAAEAVRRKELGIAVGEAMLRIAGPALETASDVARAAGASAAVTAGLGQAAQIMDKISFAMMPISAVWNLLSGLSRLGRINHEVQVESEGSARRRGFADMLGLALDNPQLARASLEDAVNRSGYVAHYSGLRDSMLPAIPQRWRKDFGALVDKYKEGSRLAREIVDKMTAAERGELAVKLAKELDGETSANRLRSWFRLPK